MTLLNGEVNANRVFADFLGYTQDELNGSLSTAPIRDAEG